MSDGRTANAPVTRRRGSPAQLARALLGAALTVGALAALAAPGQPAGGQVVWQTYQGTAAGFTVEYPADWTAAETVGADGVPAVTFSDPGGRTGIEVSVRPSGDVGTPGLDVPNTRCQPVSIAGLAGMRCLDTISFGIATTLTGDGKTYVIASVGKRPELAVYDHLLASFRPTR